MVMLRGHHLIIIPYASVVLWVLTPIFKPLQIPVDGDIGINVRLYLSYILLPREERVHPSPIGVYGDQLMVLPGPKMVFSQSRNIENRLIGSKYSRKQPSFLLSLL